MSLSAYYSPALKKWGYIGFAMSFRHSEIPSFCNFLIPIIPWLHILLNTFNVCDPTSMKLILHVVPGEQEVW